MGEKGDLEMAGASSAEGFTSPEAVERRVWRNIFAVIAISIVAAAVFADLKFMLGLAAGGALALLNYKWLHASLRAVMAVGGDKAPPGTAIKFILRWVIIGLIVYAANLTGQLEAVAILAGLFAPAVAVIIEAVYMTYKTVAHGGER